MLVKKTKSGKYSCMMTHDHRDFLSNKLQKYLTEARPNFIELSVLYSVLGELLFSKNFFLLTSTPVKIIFKRSEALAIVFMLRTDNTMLALEIKGSLHQTLS